jgi:hypothetical protein
MDGGGGGGGVRERLQPCPSINDFKGQYHEIFGFMFILIIQFSLHWPPDN